MALRAWQTGRQGSLGWKAAFLESSRPPIGAKRKLEDLIKNEPEHRALYRLLSSVVGRYIEAFDEEPLPVAVPDRAYQRLLDLVASLQASTDCRLADLNPVAACELWH
jgi:hypothetical protein